METFSLVFWQLNIQVAKTLILMIATLAGTPKLLKIAEQRELLLWVSDCNRYGDDSQNDNDTSLRSWRSTRQRLESYDTDKRACELAGFETLRSEIVDLNRDEATILMVESNFQRSEILPSEKAFAYKMRLEAMKRQAGRPAKNNSPVGNNLEFAKSSDELADKTGESKNQIYRYVRLTNLVPELLEFVDEGRIKMRPAVELSYLDEDCQRDVVDEIDLNDATPSHDQTIRMRKLFNEGNLTTEAIHAVMSEEKPNQKEKIVLRGDRVRQLIPKNIPVSQTEDFVCKALEHYNKFLRNRAERDSR